MEAFAISPDSRRLAEVARRSAAPGTVHFVVELWDLRTRRRVGEVPLYGQDEGEGIVSVAFSPDGRKLLTTGFGSTPLVLDLDVDHWAERACELAPSCRPRPSTDAPAARG